LSGGSVLKGESNITAESSTTVNTEATTEAPTEYQSLSDRIEKESKARVTASDRKETSDENIKAFESRLKSAGKRLFLNTTVTTEDEGPFTAGGRLEGTSKSKGASLNLPAESKYETPT